MSGRGFCVDGGPAPHYYVGLITAERGGLALALDDAQRRVDELNGVVAAREADDATIERERRWRDAHPIYMQQDGSRPLFREQTAEVRWRDSTPLHRECADEIRAHRNWLPKEEL